MPWAYFVDAGDWTDVLAAMAFSAATRKARALALAVLSSSSRNLSRRFCADTIRRSVHEYPALVRFRCALAHLDAELGGEEEARAIIDDLLARDLEVEYRDHEWAFSMALLANPCASVADERAAARLYSLLLPFAHVYAMAPVEGVFGAVARGLGVLATALGRYDDAERHLLAAIDLERRMGGRPWLAHGQHDLAAMLLARGDPDRARPHLDDALKAYQELGMETWAARASALA